MSNKYVLWVRHCEGCHNKTIKINIARKMLIPSLCTTLGEKQSIVFGEKFKSNIKELKSKLSEETKSKYYITDDITDDKPYPIWDEISLTAGGGSVTERENLNTILDNPVNLYSSTLPRAMETAKLISKGLINDNLFESTNKIQRIDYIQEQLALGELGNDSVNATTKLGSDNACRLLNSKFNTDYAKIDCTNILGRDEGYNNNTKFLSNKKDLSKRYEDFKTIVLPKLDTNKLNIIVSHSAFIKSALNFNNKMSNLDAYLVVYDEMGNELVDLRQLYIFNKQDWAESAYNPPNRDTIVKLKNFNNLDYIPNSLGKCNYNRSIFESNTNKDIVDNKSEVSLEMPQFQAPTVSSTQKKSWWKFWGGKTKKTKKSQKRKTRRGKKIKRKKTKGKK